MASILVIDDEELVRLTLRQALEMGGHTVVEAVDGEEGMKKFMETEPNVVITDILMPNKEGIETIQELRRIRPDVAIIAISGGGRIKETSFLDVAQSLGANAVLEKPFKLDRLLRTVDETVVNRTSGQDA